MSSLSPSLLVVGLLLGAVGGVLAAQTVSWIFNKFPKTFSPTDSDLSHARCPGHATRG